MENRRTISVVEDGVAAISTHVMEDKSISALASTVEQRFDSTSVSTVWTDDRARTSMADPFADLTDKQLTVLRHAFHEGFFERPRGANATEIADRIGISRQTFAQHLRAAQRKVFGTWQTRATGVDEVGGPFSVTHRFSMAMIVSYVKRVLYNASVANLI